MLPLAQDPIITHHHHLLLLMELLDILMDHEWLKEVVVFKCSTRRLWLLDQEVLEDPCLQTQLDIITWPDIMRHLQACPEECSFRLPMPCVPFLSNPWLVKERPMNSNVLPCNSNISTAIVEL